MNAIRQSRFSRFTYRLVWCSDRKKIDTFSPFCLDSRKMHKLEFVVVQRFLYYSLLPLLCLCDSHKILLFYYIRIIWLTLIIAFMPFITKIFSCTFFKQKLRDSELKLYFSCTYKIILFFSHSKIDFIFSGIFSGHDERKAFAMHTF